MTLYEKGKLYDISITDLRPDPNQPRKSMDPQALNELTASIKTHGIIQPLLFRVAPDDSPTLIIVAGERRYKAAQELGLAIVPGICVEGDPSEIALIENMLRQDLTPIEEAEALQALMDERDYTQEQLSNVIGKARTTLSEILSLNKLPQEVRDDCRGDHAIPRTALIAIAKKKQARSMVTAYTAYKKSQNKEKTTRTRKAPDSCAAISDLSSLDLTDLRLLTSDLWILRTSGIWRVSEAPSSA